MPDYTLRPASTSDLVPMMEIGHEGLRPHIEKVRSWNQLVEEEGFKKHFEPEKISIIQYNGVDVGYFKINELEDNIFLEGIYLHRDARSRGIGAQIIQELSRTSEKPLALRVYKQNPAVNLYRRLGFVGVSEDQDQYRMTKAPSVKQ